MRLFCKRPTKKSISLAFYKTILNSNVKNKVYLCT